MDIARDKSPWRLAGLWKIVVGLAALAIVAALAIQAEDAAPAAASEPPLSSHQFVWTDPQSGGQVEIEELVVKGCSDGHAHEVTFFYVVRNLSYDPEPGVTNGFSGFQIIFKNPVPELHNQRSPITGGPWIQNAFSGAFPPFGVEWDVPGALANLGIMPGQVGAFSFCTDHRQDLVVNDPPFDGGLGQGPNGWAHTWEDGAINVVCADHFTDGQTCIFNGPISVPGELIPVEVQKDPHLANLWLCNIAGAPGCDNKPSGVEEVNLNVDLNRQITSPDPKCTEPDPDDCRRQTIGSFEFEVRYDAKLVSVTVGPGPLLTHPDVSCASTRGEGFVQFRCLTKGKERIVSGPGTLAEVRVRATPDVYSMLIANQQNGIATQLINQGCQLSDLQGHSIAVDVCDDAAVTIRYLEGDVHADCVVDVRDQQQISFRWGARQGNLLYNSRFDLEPSAPKKGDGDIDAKDLQAVYGRHGSTCKDPHPPQPPVDPKAKVGPPPSDVSE